MKFEWDEVKNASNFEKHAVWFETRGRDGPNHFRSEGDTEGEECL